MQSELIVKARARRRVALTHVSARNRDESKIRTFRRSSSMSTSELGRTLAARRIHQVNNIFAA